MLALSMFTGKYAAYLTTSAVPALLSASRVFASATRHMKANGGRTSPPPTRGLANDKDEPAVCCVLCYTSRQDGREDLS